jgi:integrase
MPPQPRLHLLYGEWPSADRLLWEQAVSNDDPFAAGMRLAKATQKRCLRAWRRFLRFLANREPIVLESAPAERLTAERVRWFVRHLAETNRPRSVASHVDALYQAARLMMPGRDWSWLKAIKGRLYAAAPAHSPRSPVITSVLLLDLGQQLMDENKPIPGTPIRKDSAVSYRDGLLISLLAFVPLRRRNLVLEIGRHVVLVNDRWFIIIPREETKTGTSIEFPIPELLDPYLAVYLDIVRPRLLRDSRCNALWVSGKRGALSYHAIGNILARHSLRHFGFRIATHDARDAAATTWAISAPDQIGICRDLLAHSDLRMTTKHYNRARGIEASRVHGLVIANLCRKRDRN